ncbi:MAG: ABC transporter permease [Reyranella sp.]|uniref:ABC transporter permease n=1 Tax=Reyranella sp. TaxID=1929291 RepID=UPI00121D08E8|nr:ABC transporter permease [Reyranella sp.]TAJ42287.1 MAG: ABC transporter permease [Reyranella sp.]
MLAYTLRRIAQLVPVLLVLSVAVFAFVEALPGSIIDTLVGTEGGDIEEARAILTKEYGLDRPVHERYVLWLGRALQGDFGKSLVTRRPISTELLSRIPATVYLATVGIVLSMVIAVPLGTFAAVRRNSAVDYTAQVTSLAGISIPEFWFAILCVLLFSLYLGWLPSSGYVSPFEDFWGSLQFLILPAAAIGFRQAAFTTRLTRSSMLDELSKEYVDTARALGHSERKVIFKYTLRNAMIPTITISGLQLANLLGGTVVLESIFAWPGIGRAIFEAILQRDYPLIQAGVLVLGCIVVVMNLLVDLTYRLLNPRVKFA